MSDILIKGIEMPKGRGASVPLYVHSNGQVFFENGKNLTLEEREAIEVPPHGELISRQDVIEALKVACEEGCNDNYTNSVRRAIFDEVLGVVDDKEILPTILEASE